MGKGDKRTRRGKISAGSYGNVRPQGKPGNASTASDKAGKSTGRAGRRKA